MSRLSPLPLVLSLLLVACATNSPPPLAASSASDAGYAERYPAELASARARFSADEEQMKTLTAEFAKFPDELDKPSWLAVQAVMEEADRTGKGWDYAAGAAETDAVRRFYESEKDLMRRRVGGAVDYAAKQKQCELEAYGPVAGGLDRGFDDAIEHRLRSRSAAHRAIEDNQDALGKANLPKLEKQADKLALASHIVHVRLPQTKRDLDAALADASGVKSTLEREKERATVAKSNPNATKAAQQVAEKRLTAVAAAEASLDSEVAEARKLSEQLEERTKTAEREYDAAFDALIEAIEKRAQDKPKS